MPIPVVFQNRAATPALPYTYPEDMLRHKHAVAPPEHLLNLIRKLAATNNVSSTHKSYPPLSKTPEKTILKKPSETVTINANKATIAETSSSTSEETLLDELPQRANSTPVKRRSVTFADTIGEPLERVRLISEAREDPPKFLFKKQQQTHFSAFSSGYSSQSDVSFTSCGELSPTSDEEDNEVFSGISLPRSSTSRYLSKIGDTSSSPSKFSTSSIPEIARILSILQKFFPSPIRHKCDKIHWIWPMQR